MHTAVLDRPNLQSGRLKATFFRFREQQMQADGKAMTDRDREIAETFFEVAVSARQAVATNQSSPFMQVIPNDTGTAKTSLGCAFIAAAATIDPDFAAAYFAPTVLLAMEAQNRIEALLGPNSTTLWSIYHDPNRDEQQTREALGTLPHRLHWKKELPNSRIVILTTAKLKQEAKDGKNTGCLRYQGRKRNIVFIDEFPDLLDIYRVTSTQVHDLFDRLAAHDPLHPWLPVLMKAIDRMIPVMQTTGQRHLPVTVLDARDSQVFGEGILALLMRLADPALSTEARRKQTEPWQEAIDFLKAAAQGQVFYSRGGQHHYFYGYQRYLDTSYPGYVVLDATADIHAVLMLDPGVQIHPGKRLHYGQLKPYAIFHPEEFKDMRKLTDAGTRRYSHWIRDTVINNTQPGEEILVIAHKKVLEMELFAGSKDPAAPLDWDGRKVNTQHWGAGIGTNRFAHKTHVFLFGDFHLPQSAAIAYVHGWSGAPLTEAGLRLAQGADQKDGRCMPSGVYGRVLDGHELRWIKQLAMRGNARNAYVLGHCAPMKLYLSADLRLWAPRRPDLFPGIDWIEVANQDIQAHQPTGRDGLRCLLLISKKRNLDRMRSRWKRGSRAGT